jgi:hypothetical protein
VTPGAASLDVYTAEANQALGREADKLQLLSALHGRIKTYKLGELDIDETI